ncbi:MAG: hypothetical protein AAFO72_07630, partial [Pseudomonadota bacterium]
APPLIGVPPHFRILARLLPQGLNTHQAKGIVEQDETMGFSKTEDIAAFVARERELSVSDREWKFRLRGYGLAIRDEAKGRIVTALRGGQDLCVLNGTVR